jgi:hypothetical protein
MKYVRENETKDMAWFYIYVLAVMRPLGRILNILGGASLRSEILVLFNLMVKLREVGIQ